MELTYRNDSNSAESVLWGNREDILDLQVDTSRFDAFVSYAKIDDFKIIILQFCVREDFKIWI